MVFLAYVFYFTIPVPIGQIGFRTLPGYPRAKSSARSVATQIPGDEVCQVALRGRVRPRSATSATRTLDAPWAADRLRRSVPLGAERTLRVVGTFVKSVLRRRFRCVGPSFTRTNPAFRATVRAGNDRFTGVRHGAIHTGLMTSTAPTVRLPRRKIR